MLRTLALASLLVALLPAAARAYCPACATGTPTLASPGTEIPFDGRLRVALSARSRETTYDGTTLREGRVDLALSWSPLAALTVSASAPLVVHATSDGASASGLGNALAQARVVVFRDRTLAPHHLLSLGCGVLLPAPPSAANADGGTVPPLALATGVRTFGGTAGVTYAALDGPLSLAASVSGVAWLDGPGLRRTGPSLLARVAGQWQLSPAFALRAFVELRVDATSRGALGRADPDGGGLVLTAGPELLVALAESLVLVVGAGFPVAQADTGTRRDGLGLSATLVLDV